MYGSKWHVGNLVTIDEIMTAIVFTDIQQDNENKKEHWN